MTETTSDAASINDGRMLVRRETRKGDVISLAIFTDFSEHEHTFFSRDSVRRMNLFKFVFSASFYYKCFQ